MSPVFIFTSLPSQPSFVPKFLSIKDPTESHFFAFAVRSSDVIFSDTEEIFTAFCLERIGVFLGRIISFQDI